MTRTRISFILAVLLLAGFTAGIASGATVTQSITYQGKLTDAAGNPLTGTHSVKFSLYEAATGGTALAGTTQSVTCTGGLFTTTLPLAATSYDGRALWLGIKVGSDPEMTPRQEIRPVPYALSLRPGAVMGGTGAGNVFTIGIEGEGTALDVSAFGTGGTGLSAYANGGNGRAISATASGAGSTALNAGTISSSSIAIVASASGDDSTAIFASTIRTGSDAIEATTSEDSSRGIYVFTEGKQSPGLYALTLNDGSSAVEAHSYGNSPAVYGEGMVGVFGTGREGGYFTTEVAGTGIADETYGVNVSTTLPWSPGIRVSTTGPAADGIDITTANTGAEGIFVRTRGISSHGIITNTELASSYGFGTNTMGGLSPGFSAYTSGPGSAGARITTIGPNSDGVNVSATGPGSRGVYASAAQAESVIGESTGSYAGVKGSSPNKAGVWGVSTSDVGVYGDTISGTYGVFTHDKMYAGAGIDAPNVDVAEYMATAGDPAPGTVLVIGEGGTLEISATAYDTRVAGIVSTAPGVSLGTKEAGNDGEVPVAVAGRVPCRVDAGYGAIHAGDLLSTSATPGHAMKAVPVMISGYGFYPDGTILGKAMESLESGTGTIEVLVTLQ